MKRMINNFPSGSMMDQHFANMRSLIQVSEMCCVIVLDLCTVSMSILKMIALILAYNVKALILTYNVIALILAYNMIVLILAYNVVALILSVWYAM